MAFDPNTNEYEPDDEGYCEVCGAELEYEDCPECGGEGFYEHDGDAEEPWDSLETCEECGGRGIFEYCPNAKAHPREEAEV